MEKILNFIVNEKNELLLLLGCPNDPQLKKSIWYVVTGAIEKNDSSKEDAVLRESLEETGLKVENLFYLNWILKYNSLGISCTEYVYISYVKSDKIKLNEENIDYKWCNINEFIDKIYWYGDKLILDNVLKCALQNSLFFKDEHIDLF